MPCRRHPESRNRIVISGRPLESMCLGRGLHIVQMWPTTAPARALSQCASGDRRRPRGIGGREEGARRRPRTPCAPPSATSASFALQLGPLRHSPVCSAVAPGCGAMAAQLGAEHIRPPIDVKRARGGPVRPRREGALSSHASGSSCEPRPPPPRQGGAPARGREPSGHGALSGGGGWGDAWSTHAPTPPPGGGLSGRGSRGWLGAPGRFPPLSHPPPPMGVWPLAWAPLAAQVGHDQSCAVPFGAVPRHSRRLRCPPQLALRHCRDSGDPRGRCAARSPRLPAAVPVCNG